MLELFLSLIFSMGQIFYLQLAELAFWPLCLALLVVVYGGVSFYYVDRNVQTIQALYQKKTPLVYLTLSAIAVCFVLAFIPDRQPTQVTDFIKLILSWSYFFVGSIHLWAFVSKGSQFDFDRPRTQSRRYFWLTAGVHFAVALVYFVAYYPGILTIDSVNQWQQAHGNVLNDWHPVFYTLLLKLTTAIADTPAVFVFMQMTIYALVLGSLHQFLYRRGVKKPYLIGLLVLTAFYPYFPLTSVTIIKDVLFTLCLLAYMLQLNEMLTTQGRVLRQPLFLVTLFFANLGFIFFRHNGWPVFLLTLVILTPFIFKKVYGRFFLVSFVALLLHVVITGPVYQRLNVVPAESTEKLGLTLQIIGGVVTGAGEIDETERAVIEKLMPISDWHKHYNNSDVDKIKFYSPLDKNYMREHASEVIQTTLSLSRKNPGLALKAYLNQTQILWRANLADDDARTIFRRRYFETLRPIYFLNKDQIEALQPNYQEFDYSDYHDGILPLRHFLEKAVMAPLNARNVRQFMMPAFAFVLSILLIMVLIFKGKLRDLLSLLPWIINIGSLFVAVPAQDIRYGYINLFGAILVFALTMRAEERDPQLEQRSFKQV